MSGFNTSWELKFIMPEDTDSDTAGDVRTMIESLEIQLKKLFPQIEIVDETTYW